MVQRGAINPDRFKKLVYDLYNRPSESSDLRCKNVYSTFMNIKDELFTEENECRKQKGYKCPELEIKINGVPVIALLDTGSQCNGISAEWYNKNKEQLGRVEMLRLSNTTIKGAIGQRSKHVNQQIFVEVAIKQHKFDCVFVVIPGLVRDCILGMPMLQEENCIINLSDNCITFNSHENRQELPVTAEMMGVELGDEGPNSEQDISLKVEEITGLPECTREKLQRILLENREVFRQRPGRITGYQHRLRVTDRSPYCLKGWPIPFKYQKAVDEEIRRMEEYGVIERAASPYINPIVTVIKKDQSVRLCLDARRINSVTVPDFEGAVPVNEVLANCGGIKVMSSIDLTSSFWQVPLAEDSRDFTGFLYKGRCYRYTVTPFGLKTSLASLTRGLDISLSDEVKDFTIIYVDDCLCISSSEEEHLKQLGLLLADLKRANLTVNLKKCKFFRERIDYLGYVLSTKGISASPDKVAAIQNFPRPKNPKQLKGFLGLTNFYNKFTSRYAEATQPLLQLLKKGNKFKWTAELDQQFNTVKQLFINTVMLRHPDPNKRFYLQTDASKYALGGQLYQIDDDGEIGVVAFTSRVFRGAELNYFTTELELLSIVHCLSKFRQYVLGRPLTIVTDNKALIFIQRCHLNNSRMTRWILGIQEYDFNIIHCKGKENVVADVLSRYPEDTQGHRYIEENDEFQISAINIKLNKDTSQKLKEVGRHQQQDEKLYGIINKLINNTDRKVLERYAWCNNRLYRMEKGVWKLMLPDALGQLMIKEIHEKYGHIGSTRTYNMFKENFTGDKVSHIVKATIRRCEVCQLCKDHHRVGIGETKPIIPAGKGCLISADFYGPLPTSIGGVRHLLVFIDNFTKYVKLYTMKRATTTIAINKLRLYSQEVGTPKAILTDNGTQFTSPKWIKQLEAMNIKPKFTAIRNPCTNLAERVNRQLGNMFRIFASEQHSKWAKYVSLIENSINQTYQETIRMTPYQAQWQRKPERPWSKYMDQEMCMGEPQVDPQEIHLRIKERSERRAKKLNSRGNLIKFQKGDKVLVKTNPISDATRKIISKFCALYEGPYEVVEKKGEATYVLANRRNQKEIRGIFNVRQLKRFYEN